MRKSYDQYATAAQFRNAVIREQLQALQDFVSVSDKVLRLPFPGRMAADRNSETYKELAVEMQNIVTEHSRGTLELWASMFRYEVGNGYVPAEIEASQEDELSQEDETVTPSPEKTPKSNGRKPTAETAEATSP